jgi:hypothetical protein
MSRNPRPYFFSAAISAVCLATLLATFAACRDSRVVTYQAPKEPAVRVETSSAFAAADASPVSQIRWEAPERWKPAAPANAAAANIRVGSFTITSAASDGRALAADMAVTTFPGDVGGDLANINRWRGQLNLAPIAAAQLSDATTIIAAPAGEFLLADMTGDVTDDTSSRKRTLGAWLKQPAQNRTWFFKLTGDTELVAAERDAFLAFLQTVAFDAPAK